MLIFIKLRTSIQKNDLKYCKMLIKVVVNITLNNNKKQPDSQMDRASDIF